MKTALTSSQGHHNQVPHLVPTGVTSQEYHHLSHSHTGHQASSTQILEDRPHPNLSRVLYELVWAVWDRYWLKEHTKWESSGATHAWLMPNAPVLTPLPPIDTGWVVGSMGCWWQMGSPPQLSLSPEPDSWHWAIPPSSPDVAGSSHTYEHHWDI